MKSSFIGVMKMDALWSKSLNSLDVWLMEKPMNKRFRMLRSLSQSGLRLRSVWVEKYLNPGAD